MKTKKSAVFAGVMAMMLGLAIVGCDAGAGSSGGTNTVNVPGGGYKSNTWTSGNVTLTLTEITASAYSLKSGAVFSVSNPQPNEIFRYTLSVNSTIVSSGTVTIRSSYWTFVPAATGEQPFYANVIGDSLVFPSGIGGIGVESFTISLTTDNTNGGNNGGSGEETSGGANGDNNDETGGGNGDGSGGTGDSGNEGGTTGGNDDGNSEETEGGSEKKDVWWGNKQEFYSVTNGVAASLSYEIVYECTNYVDETHYEWRYSYTVPNNTFNTYDTYTYSHIGSTANEISYSRNGETGQMNAHTILSSTISTDYFDNSQREDVETIYITESNAVYNYVYDMDFGLVKQHRGNSTSTTNGYSEWEYTYTITLLSDVGGLKTYKYYLTNTGGNGAYEIYTVKDGVTLSISSYDTDGALSCTVTYTFPDDSIIRERFPTFTLSRYSYVSTPSNNNYQTCELLESTGSLLKIRIKTFNPSGVLMTQYDTSYGKM